MSEAEIALRLLAGTVLILLNGFFVTVEFALTRLRQLPRDEVRESKGLRRAWEMTEELEIYLTGCQLGISATTILLGVVAEPAVTELLLPLAELLGVPEGSTRIVSVVVGILVLNLAHKIYGEQAPTYLGVERPREVAEKLGPILYVWNRVMYPLIMLGDSLAKLSLRPLGVEITRSWTEEGEAGGQEGRGDGRTVRSRADLRREMADLLRKGPLPRERRDEVLRALDIGTREIREIMVPIEAVHALDPESPEEALRVVTRTRHVRYPVRAADGEGFQGVVYVPSLLEHVDGLRSGEVSLGTLASRVPELPPDLPISVLIDRLQEAHQEVAFVREGSRVVGMVTVTDAFEAIAGQLEDPLD